MDIDLTAGQISGLIAYIVPLIYCMFLVVRDYRRKRKTGIWESERGFVICAGIMACFPFYNLLWMLIHLAFLPFQPKAGMGPT